MAGDSEQQPLALVVEDDDQIAQLIRFILQQEGYEVHCAASAQAGSELIERLAPPALVTLDIRLPDASGVDLIVQIKSTAGWEKVPIVMVTATPKDESLNWAIKTGAKGYLVKPFKPEDLIDCVRRVVAKKPAP